MELYGKSDIGLKRETNQDSFYMENLSENFSLLIVCDGMGGVNGGGIASEVAVNSIKEQIKLAFNESMDQKSIGNLLESAIYNANDAIYQKAQEDLDLNGMGTTVIACIVFYDQLHIIHVGDSRAYFITDNEICQLTTDHSIVQEMLDNGEITRKQAKNHPRKNLITRALGVSDKIPGDYIEREIHKGDTLLICTDGLSNYVSIEEIHDCYKKNNSISNLGNTLISNAKILGGDDNITVAILKR